MTLRSRDFKSLASAIPPPGRPRGGPQPGGGYYGGRGMVSQADSRMDSLRRAC